ncbi:MAG: phosphoethanolamine transferase, partial [Campylobacterota bacterium]|nr:phosphoethanolamine transferase [Campylobacterota bacterium]
MLKRNYLLILVIIIVIFTSYNYLSPLGNANVNLNQQDYSLKTYNISKENKWSAFDDLKNGRFFIHTGAKKAVKGVFVFKKSGQLVLDFSVRKPSTFGDIEFTVYKNDHKIDKSIVTAKQTNQVVLNIKNGDKVEIAADSLGDISHDLGNLQIIIQEPLFAFKNILAPFLWSLLFIFLFGKKHSYIAANSYIIFILTLFAEKLNFGILNFVTLLVYMLLLFALTFLFTLVYQEFAGLKKFRVVSIVSFSIAFIVYVIPLFFIIYALNFDTRMTMDILHTVFQSNSGESYDFISDFISWKYILLFVSITAIVGTLLYRQEKKETLEIEKSLLIFIIISFLSISITQFSQLRLANFVIEGFDRYSEELKLFREVQEKRKAGEIKFSARKKAQGETYIVVIGESLHKKHMGIYGYLRDTTPLLSKMNDDEELMVFTNVYSNHHVTVPVLELSLTEANQYNKRNYYDSISIIELLKKADIETYWLTNQTIYGAWDNMVSVIASSSDNLVALNKSMGGENKTQKYDGILINEVKNILTKKTDKNRVVFVHLMGNHTSYDERYPKDKYSVYNEQLKQGEFGSTVSKNNSIDYYDNSVVYNDYVVSSILKELQKEKGVSGFIYMSDHADDIDAELAHMLGRFTYEMVQIPMIGWFSEKYKKEYGSKYNTLFSNTDKLYSNDMLYDTLIGMFDVKTDKYNSKYDLTSKDYALNPKDALVLRDFAFNPNETSVATPARHYTERSNHIYWQKVNAKYLIDTNQSSRIFPHRVNSIGKLKDVWSDGFRSFEIDVRFGDNNSETFQVGHNKGLMGFGLEEFLSRVDYAQIERIWFDFKNLNEGNYKKALERLEYLDKKFDIKRKLIVESGTTSEIFKEFRKNGWHTSYYMPTTRIVNLLQEDNKSEMKKLAVQIAKQVETQNVAAVSFDYKLYSFIKDYLEPLISDNIVYHMWLGPHLGSNNFKNELSKNPMYLDSRVKTILSFYKSQYY